MACPGKRYDNGSSTIDMGARRYTADTGRFLQQDSYYDALDNLDLSEDPLSGNRYALAGGNPINFIEADGHVLEGRTNGGQPSCDAVDTQAVAAGQCQGAPANQVGDTSGAEKEAELAEFNGICRDAPRAPLAELIRLLRRCSQLAADLHRSPDWLARAWRWLGQQQCQSTPVTGMATMGCDVDVAKWGWKNRETLAGLACGIGVTAASDGAAAGAALTAFRFCAYALFGVDGVRAAKKRYPNAGVAGAICFMIATYGAEKTKLGRLTKKAGGVCGKLLDTGAVMGLTHQ